MTYPVWDPWSLPKAWFGQARTNAHRAREARSDAKRRTAAPISSSRYCTSSALRSRRARSSGASSASSSGCASSETSSSIMNRSAGIGGQSAPRQVSPGASCGVQGRVECRHVDPGSGYRLTSCRSRCRRLSITVRRPTHSLGRPGCVRWARENQVAVACEGAASILASSGGPFIRALSELKGELGGRGLTPWVDEEPSVAYRQETPGVRGRR